MAAPPSLTPALIVGAIGYGETSRIVRLVTRDHGLVSAIAKGALRPRSRFGASLRLLSEGQAHVIWSRSSDLHLLAAFDLESSHPGLALDMERFLSASALAEVASRFVSSGPNPGLYSLLVGAMRVLEATPPAEAAVMGVHLLWHLIGELGVSPSVEFCARDGAPILPEVGAVFSFLDGGLLCGGCSDGTTITTRLAAEDVAALSALLSPEGALPEMDPPHLAAHRRLLMRWVQQHLGEGPMPALELWQRGLSP